MHLEETLKVSVTSSLCRWLSTGTVLREGVESPSLGYPKCVWAQSWAVCSGESSLSKEAGLGDPQWSLTLTHSVVRLNSCRGPSHPFRPSWGKLFPCTGCSGRAADPWCGSCHSWFSYVDYPKAIGLGLGLGEKVREKRGWELHWEHSNHQQIHKGKAIRSLWASSTTQPEKQLLMSSLTPKPFRKYF